MIDINDARKALDASLAGAANGTEFDAAGFATHVARKALDELEALRKPERPDLAAWREELAKADRLWAKGWASSHAHAYRRVVALLGCALDALAAGWEPAVDVVERAAIALCGYKNGEHAYVTACESWKHQDVATQAANLAQARAVLRSAGRLPEPADVVTVRSIIGRVRDVMRDEPTISPVGVIEEFERATNKIPLRAQDPVDIEGACEAAWNAGDSIATVGTWQHQSDNERDIWRDFVRCAFAHVGRKPVAITNEVVEAASIRAWCSGASGTIESWHNGAPQDAIRRDTRAVLEYAASRGVAPSPIASGDSWDQAPDALERAAIVAWCAGAPGRLPPEWNQATPSARGLYCGIAHAVLVCAGMPAHAPAVDPREERLARYRCAVVPLVPTSRWDGAKQVPVLDRDVDNEIEQRARRMLAAERTPARG